MRTALAVAPAPVAAIDACAEQHYDRLRQRRNWLTARIAAKQSVGWDVEYDTAERDALTWALEQLAAAK